MTEVINVVTSCSLEGWEKYGAKFVDTFEKYWPASVALHVVSEHDLPIKFVNPKRFFHKLDRSRAWRSFRTDNAERKWTHGDSRTARPAGVAPIWRESAGYNFRFDAYKFSKKVFAIELIAEDFRTGRLFWFDADTLTHATVPLELFAQMMPIGHAVSCLSRVGYHSECGFIGYNLDHGQAIAFIKALSDLYTTGEVFKLAEWHDSWVFDWLRNKLMISTYNIPHRSQGHPFINSELGRYFDHLKGNRKTQGRSLLGEHILNEKAPYWQGGHHI